MLYEPSLFLDRIVRFLLPFFLPLTVDKVLARMEIIETLASYGIRTRAEMIAATQIIAFSFSALDVLAEAKASTTMSESMRIRARSCASGLNRASQQNDKALEKRLKCDIPKGEDDFASVLDNFSDAEVEEVLAKVQGDIDGQRGRIADPAPASATATSRAPAETTPAETTPAETTPANPVPASAAPAETKPVPPAPVQPAPAKAAAASPAAAPPAAAAPSPPKPSGPTPPFQPSTLDAKLQRLLQDMAERRQASLAAAPNRSPPR